MSDAPTILLNSICNFNVVGHIREKKVTYGIDVMDIGQSEYKTQSNYDVTNSIVFINHQINVNDFRKKSKKKAALAGSLKRL